MQKWKLSRPSLATQAWSKGSSCSLFSSFCNLRITNFLFPDIYQQSIRFLSQSIEQTQYFPITNNPTVSFSFPTSLPTSQNGSLQVGPLLTAPIHYKIIAMKRLTAEQLRKLMPVFEVQAYRTSEDKCEYIHDLILVALHKRKLPHAQLCMNELIQIVNLLQIPLRTAQMSQLYLYATFQKNESLSQTKNKIIAILNQERRKVDPRAAAEWLQDKITRKEINFAPKRQRAISGPVVKKQTEMKSQHLPSLIGSSTQKLQEELKYLIQIFQEMEDERQESGLVPLNDEGEDNDVEVPFANIPYDPELYDLNNKLCRLRIKAEDRLSRIIQLAREDPRIRNKLEQAIQRFQKARIEANQKVGRVGAMKAQKRLQERKERDHQKIRNLQLGENDNLVHASHLYSLLTLPEIKSNRLII